MQDWKAWDIRFLRSVNSLESELRSKAQPRHRKFTAEDAENRTQLRPAVEKHEQQRCVAGIQYFLMLKKFLDGFMEVIK